MGGCLAELSVQTAIHPVDPVASHRYEKWFHAHPDKWRKMHRQVGCFSPGHPTQAAWFSHECSFNPLPFSRRPQEHRLEEQVEIPLGLSSLGPARVLGEVCVRHRSSVHSSEVEGCQKSLTDAPWPCRSIHTHTHTHTHACKLRPLATGDREHSVIAQFFRRGSGRGTSPETLYWVAPEAVTACLALALVACGQEKCSEHLLLLEQHEIIPRPGVLPDLGELLKKPSGHPGASGRYCFAAQGQAPGGSSPQKPSKVNQPDGVSMGLHGACL